MISERTLCGVLRITPDISKALIWHLPLRQRWQVIVRESKSRLPVEKVELLRQLSKRIEKIARDRNIVVHGVIHAKISAVSKTKRGDKLPLRQAEYSRAPCWTIYIGEDAGKNFPISKLALQKIIANIQNVTNELEVFNSEHNFVIGTDPDDYVQTDWPKSL